jgi:hypothetical protein
MGATTEHMDRNGVPGPSDDNGANTAEPSVDLTAAIASMAAGAQAKGATLYSPPAGTGL